MQLEGIEEDEEGENNMLQAEHLSLSLAVMQAIRMKDELKHLVPANRLQRPSGR